jgi:hypothetical protein
MSKKKKKRLINVLCKKLTENNFQCGQAESDADHLIGRSALDCVFPHVQFYLKKSVQVMSTIWVDCHIVNLSFNCRYLETRAGSWILSMYFSEILMCVNVLPYLLGNYYQSLQTQLKLLFINLLKKATLNNLTTI